MAVGSGLGNWQAEGSGWSSVSHPFALHSFDRKLSPDKVGTYYDRSDSKVARTALRLRVEQD